MRASCQGWPELRARVRGAVNRAGSESCARAGGAEQAGDWKVSYRIHHMPVQQGV